MNRPTRNMRGAAEHVKMRSAPAPGHRNERRSTERAVAQQGADGETQKDRHSAPCTLPIAAEHGADHVSTLPCAAHHGAECISTTTDVLRACAPLLPDVEASRFHSAATILNEGKQGPVQSLCAKKKGWDASLRGSGLRPGTKRSCGRDTRLGIESDIWGA